MMKNKSKIQGMATLPSWRACKKDGFKASLMTRTSDTVRTHLQRFRALGEGLLKLCAHQSPYTGRTHRLFPSPQAASVRPRFEPTATPPSRVTSRGCYRYANPPPLHIPAAAQNAHALNAFSNGNSCTAARPCDLEEAKGMRRKFL